jgi:eukaryotic-like serine/threonine-protein kinase
LININNYNGSSWFRPVARCLLQAIHFIHLNGLVHKDIHLGNAFTSFIRDEMTPAQPGTISFKLGDLGIANVVQNIRPGNTNLANWMLPPEYLAPDQFGPLDQRIDIYHCGLLLLNLWHGQDMRFTPEQVLEGVPRQLALALPAPLNFALEKALRRHVQHRTATALELWRDLNSAANG